jgi:hypothetical protein
MTRLITRTNFIVTEDLEYGVTFGCTPIEPCRGFERCIMISVLIMCELLNFGDRENMYSSETLVPHLSDYKLQYLRILQ